MVEVFREVKRVLKKDGTLWLNLGDSYAGSGRGRDADGTWNQGKGGSKQETNVGSITGRVVNHKSYSKKAIEAGVIGNAWVKPPPGLKQKDLVGIPWMVAFALRADGWYLRQDIIWAKPNPMPESVNDRCTKSHEYIFLMSKQPKYYFDNEAVQEVAVTDENRPSGVVREREYGYNSKQKIIRSMWKEKATSEGSVHVHKKGNKMDGVKDDPLYATKPQRNMVTGAFRNRRSVWTVTTHPFKDAHFATFPEKLIEPMVLAGCPKGGIVLDPFFGAGTTGVVCKKLGRNYIGIDLNKQYCEMSEKRIAAAPQPFI